jgi:hypothetical protein
VTLLTRGRVDNWRVSTFLGMTAEMLERMDGPIIRKRVGIQKSFLSQGQEFPPFPSVQAVREFVRGVFSQVKLATLLSVGVLLSGCTASYVTNEAIESNRAVEGGTNAILVTNILRARDGLTPYYSDISHLRGSLQAQASVSAPAAYGPYDVGHWVTRNMIEPGASSPSEPVL